MEIFLYCGRCSFISRLYFHYFFSVASFIQVCRCSVFCSILFCSVLWFYIFIYGRAFYPVFFLVLMISVCIAIMSMLFFLTLSFLFIASDWKTLRRSENAKEKNDVRTMANHRARAHLENSYVWISYHLLSLRCTTLCSCFWSSLLVSFSLRLFTALCAVHAWNNWTPEIVFAECLSVCVCIYVLCVNSDCYTQLIKWKCERDQLASTQILLLLS